MLRGTGICIAAVALACLCLPAAARANGDPASDYLLAQDVFYPLGVSVDPTAKQQLDRAVRTAKARGFPIKVALIAHSSDLGLVSQLYGKPQQYAEFLGGELVFLYRDGLLIAMPNGYGYSENGRPSTAMADSLADLPEPGFEATPLVQAATVAVGRLAEAAGHPISDVVPTENDSGGHGTVLVAAGGAALAFVAMVAVALLLVRRRRTARD